MYYDVSPSLSLAIRNHEGSKSIYQNILAKYITPSITSINEKNYEKTQEILVSSINEMMDEYLLKKD